MMLQYTLLLFVVCPCCILCETYYISPFTNGSLSCPSEPCVSFAQVATIVNESIDSNISLSLIFLPGNHSLDALLSAKLLRCFKMDVLDNSSDVTIECYSRKFNLDISDVRDVLLNGIQFVGCNSSFYRIEQVQIIDCRFSFSKDTALKLVNSSVYIANSLFIYNYNGILAVESTASIHLSNFTHNSKSAIEMTRSNVTTTEINVYHNRGIVVGNNSTFIDNQSKFSNNNATQYNSGLISCCKCIINFFKTEISDNNGNIIVCSSTFWGRVSIVQSVIINNFGSVINVKFCSHMCIISSWFVNNVAYGHALLSVFQLLNEIYVVESSFINNLVHGGQGAVMKFSLGPSVISIKSSLFSNNIIRQGDGGVINSISTVIITLVDCQFESNNADGKGGVLHAANRAVYTPRKFSSINVSNCTFYNNSAHDGGTFYAQFIHVSIQQSEFKANSAPIGAVMFLSEKSSVKIVDTIIIKNTANMGAIFLMECTVNLSNIWFEGNLGSFLAYNSMISFVGYSKFSNSLLASNTTLQEGGAITAFQSELAWYGNCTLSNNSAEYGGAIHATESKLHFCGKMVIEENSATKSGGGVYLQQSEFLCKSANVTFANNIALHGGGGGIYAMGSSIRLDYSSIGEYTVIYYDGSQLVFFKNIAKKGGAICLESNAKLYILKKDTHKRISPPQALYLHLLEERLIKALSFISNTADYGGAIYVADNTNFATCDSAPNNSYFNSGSAECFFQILLLNNGSLTRRYDYYKSYLISTDNLAHISGSTLYGGLLDRCMLSPFTNLFSEKSDFFNILADIDSEISSAAVRVCFCRDNYSEPDCNYQPSSIKIKKGQKFTVTVAAVDQVNHTVKSATIHSSHD